MFPKYDLEGQSGVWQCFFWTTHRCFNWSNPKEDNTVNMQIPNSNGCKTIKRIFLLDDKCYLCLQMYFNLISCLLLLLSGRRWRKRWCQRERGGILTDRKCWTICKKYIFSQTFREGEPAACWHQGSRGKVDTDDTIFALTQHQKHNVHFFKDISFPEFIFKTYVWLFLDFHSTLLNVLYFLLVAMSPRWKMMRLRSHRRRRGRASRLAERRRQKKAK